MNPTLSPASGDRRQAIWPWLVMPLVTLLLFYLFYGFDRLHREYPDPDTRHTAQSDDSSSTDSDAR